MFLLMQIEWEFNYSAWNERTYYVLVKKVKLLQKLYETRKINSICLFKLITK